MQIQLRFHDSVTNLYTHKRSSFSVYRKNSLNIALLEIIGMVVFSYIFR